MRLGRLKNRNFTGFSALFQQVLRERFGYAAHPFRTT